MTTLTSDLERKGVPWRVGFWRAVVVGAVVVCLIPIAWSWATRPFRMAKRFVDLVNQQQYGQAVKLVQIDDQRMIPSAFWAQFKGKNVVVLSSPGPWTLLGGGMGLTFGFQDPGGTTATGSGIYFVVTGNTIRVADVTFTESN